MTLSCLPTSSTYEDFGGSIQDYSPLEDPSTQLSAVESNPMRASVAAMTNTCFRAIVNFSYNTSDGYFILNNLQTVYDQTQTANPTFSYVTAGEYTITFPTEVIDVTGQTQNLNFLGAVGNIDVLNTGGWWVTVQVVNSYTVTVYLNNSSGLVDVANSNMEIFIR